MNQFSHYGRIAEARGRRVMTTRRHFNYELSSRDRRGCSAASLIKTMPADDDTDKICRRQVKFKRKLDLNRSNCLNVISSRPDPFIYLLKPF